MSEQKQSGLGGDESVFIVRSPPGGVLWELWSCGCCLITPWESDLSLSGGKHGPHTEQ